MKEESRSRVSGATLEAQLADRWSSIIHSHPELADNWASIFGDDPEAPTVDQVAQEVFTDWRASLLAGNVERIAPLD